MHGIRFIMFKILLKSFFVVAIACILMHVKGCHKQDPVHIRFATERDIPACRQLMYHVFTTIYRSIVPISDEELAEDLDDLNKYASQLFVAETASKEIVGCMLIFPFSPPDISGGFDSIDLGINGIRQRFQADSSIAYVSRLYVDEKYRGKGIGKKLLQSVTQYFPAVDMLFLDTMALNKNSVDFYTHLGFKQQHKWIQNGTEIILFSINVKELFS
jgi:GNAT superfamily N-acetyltransferase